MFEKEAEEYQKQIQQEYLDLGKNGAYPPLWERIGELWQKGAEFGYNKANEWHYVKDRDLPKGKDTVLIYWKSGNLKCVSVVEPYKVTEDTHIIAWKEIVLPKRSE